MAHDRLIAELERRREEARAMGGPEKLAARKKRGQLNGEERLAALLDPGSFFEVGLLGASSVYETDVGATPRDGKLTGFGRIEGRDVGVVANDFTTKGSSTSATNSKRWATSGGHVPNAACRSCISGESTGARLPDAMGSKGMGSMLGNDISQFRRMRDTPWVAAALDTSFGSSAWQCCCADFAVMKKGSIMAVSSPRLVSMATGEKVDLEELGGWRLHAEQTGLIDYFVDTDAEAMSAIRRFLSYMPTHHGEAPPTAPVPEGSDDGQEQHPGNPAGKANASLQHEEDRRDHRRSQQLLRDQAALRPASDRGPGAPGRKQRRHHRQQPHVGGGALVGVTPAARSWISPCCATSFNIPLIRLMDTPGFVVGLDAERRGAPGHIMNFMNATCLTTVPQITVIVRKAYGRAYVAMGGGAHNDAMVAWPTAEVSFMDPVFATNIVHNKTAGDDGFRGGARDHIQKDLEIWDMARIFSAHDVIKPQETRGLLTRMLDVQRRRRTGRVGQHLMRTWPTSY